MKSLMLLKLNDFCTQFAIVFNVNSQKIHAYLVKKFMIVKGEGVAPSLDGVAFKIMYNKHFDYYFLNATKTETKFKKKYQKKKQK